MIKNIILTLSILLNVAVLVFAIWAYVMFNNGYFSHAVKYPFFRTLLFNRFELVDIVG